MEQWLTGVNTMPVTHIKNMLCRQREYINQHTDILEYSEEKKAKIWAMYKHTNKSMKSTENSSPLYQTYTSTVSSKA